MNDEYLFLANDLDAAARQDAEYLAANNGDPHQDIDERREAALGYLEETGGIPDVAVVGYDKLSPEDKITVRRQRIIRMQQEREQEIAELDKLYRQQMAEVLERGRTKE